ncbi:MAG TPA: hypothetical protein VFN10_08975 [Thermoanaerobaculia bacterium]|nr:hypothetical protein [Thermoanaerobaculia bacterium]
MLSIRSAFFVALLLTLSCAATQAPVRPWRVAVETSGGISGRGNGSASIDSEAKVAVTTIARKECASTATEDELARFDQALAAAKPEQWRESYMPKDICCDRIESVLTVTIGEKTYTTKWLEVEALPRDVRAIAEALSAVRHAHDCK